MTINVTDVSESSLGIQIILTTSLDSPAKAMDVEITPRMRQIEKQLRKQFDQLEDLELTQVDHFRTEQQWSFTCSSQ